MPFTFLYITTPNKKEAQQISKHLLQKKLIACANIFPVESMYWWKGKIVNGKEAVLIVKTMKSKVAAVRKEIEEVHSYEIPCIAEIDVKMNGKYGEWIGEQIK